VRQAGFELTRASPFEDKSSECRLYFGWVTGIEANLRSKRDRLISILLALPKSLQTLVIHR